MINYKEILRFHSLGINKTRIAESCGCARSTVIVALRRAAEQELSWNKIKYCSTEETVRKLYPSTALGQQYKMPDYEWVHREMQKSGVTLSLLWVEYCEQCCQSGDLPYKSTQFNKYCADYVHKTTMHLEHKPGETMQVDWAGQTAALVDTDTEERLDAYLFVAVLPYSGYAYTSFPGHEAGSLDHRPCQCLPEILVASPVSSRRTTSRPAHSRTPGRKRCSTRSTRRWQSAMVPPFFQLGPAVPRTRPLWRAPWAWSPPGSWQPCATASFCPSWN